MINRHLVLDKESQNIMRLQVRDDTTTKYGIVKVSTGILQLEKLSEFAMREFAKN